MGQAEPIMLRGARLPGDEYANKWIVLVLAGSATFMTTLDSSIVNISLPNIAHAFRIPLSGSIEWVVIGYLVVIAAMLLTFGRLADMVGRKAVFLGGLVLFTLGSAVCGAAPSLGALVAARCFQGIGASAIFAVNLAMIAGAFPPRERGRALGTNAILVSMGISAGPTVGGILTQVGTWRWIFYVNLPIGIIVIVAGWRLLTERFHLSESHFDLPGAASLALGLASLTLGLSFGREWGWTSGKFLLSMVLAVFGFSAAAVIERRATFPVINLSLFRQRVFAFANVSLMMAMLALFAVGFLLPFYLEELRGFDTLQAGLLLTPFSLTFAAIAPISGTLADRYGSRWLSPLGLSISCAGLVLLSTLNASSPMILLVLYQVGTAVGQAMFMPPNARALMGAAPPNQTGAASGILASSRVVGQSISVAVAGTVFTSFGAAQAGILLAARRTSLSGSHLLHLQHTFVAGMHAAFLVSAGLAATGVFTAVVRGREEGARG